MKRKCIILSIIVIALLLLVVLVTNVIYNSNEENFKYSYECCDDKNGTVYYQSPCKCKADKNIFEKILVVLGIK